MPVLGDGFDSKDGLPCKDAGAAARADGRGAGGRTDGRTEVRRADMRNGLSYEYRYFVDLSTELA